MARSRRANSRQATTAPAMPMRGDHRGGPGTKRASRGQPEVNERRDIDQPRRRRISRPHRRWNDAAPATGGWWWPSPRRWAPRSRIPRRHAHPDRGHRQRPSRRSAWSAPACGWAASPARRQAIWARPTRYVDPDRAPSARHSSPAGAAPHARLRSSRRAAGGGSLMAHRPRLEMLPACSVSAHRPWSGCASATA
jgi:hypothetical protein